LGGSHAVLSLIFLQFSDLDAAPKNTIFQIETESTHLIALVRRSADFPGKRVSWGEKGQDQEQNKDLETRIKTSRGAPKNTIQCKNHPAGFPNFGWRAAAAGLKPLAAARPHH